MSKSYINSFRFFFVCIDLLILNSVHFILMVSSSRISVDADQHYVILFLAANMIWLLSAYASGLYINTGNPDFLHFNKATVKCLIVYYIGMITFTFFYHYSYSRLFIIMSFLVFGSFLLLERFILFSALKYLNKFTKSGRRIVIIGYNEVAKKLAGSFLSRNRNLNVDGYFDDRASVNELSLFPIIGNVDECVNYAVKNNISEIYSTISPEKNNALYEMAQTAEKCLIRFRFVPDFKFYVNRITHIEYIDELAVLSLRSEPLEDGANQVKKRLFDVLFSLGVIIFLLSWITPILAILIKLNSRGPVFFVQIRSGKDNKPFHCIKFRTLSVNNEAHSKQVTKNDKRITSFGRFLRKSNLDELPQFINVLIGNMSAVGPRPHMLIHTESFSKILEAYMIRHFVKPGVTGWAQVKGYRGEIKKEEELRNRIEHDIWYLENWSLWVDFRIIWLTIISIFKGDKNAY